MVDINTFFNISFFETGFHCVAKAGLKLATILLSQPPVCKTQVKPNIKRQRMSEWIQCCFTYLRPDYNSSDVSKTASRQHEKQNALFIYKNYSTVSTESSESQFSSRVTWSPRRVHPGNQSCLSQKTYLRNSSIKFLNVNVMSFPYHSLEEHLRWKTTGRFYGETHLYVWVTRKTRYTCVNRAEHLKTLKSKHQTISNHYLLQLTFLYYLYQNQMTSANTSKYFEEMLY